METLMFSRRTLWVFLLASLTLLSTVASAQSKKFLILSQTQGKGSTAFASTVAAMGGSILKNHEGIGVLTVTSNDPNFQRIVSTLPGVLSVAEDRSIQWVPNETVLDAGLSVAPDAGVTGNPAAFGATQWAWKAISADKTFAAGKLGQGARVAVLDSGIVTNHLEFVDGLNFNRALSKSFVAAEPNLDPPAGVFNHGTHVAGIIAARGVAILGVAPRAEIVAVKVLSAAGSGSFDDVISGIEYASGPLVHADIINMSLGALFTPNNSGPGSPDGDLVKAIERAVTQATKNGTLVISAAGNDATNLNQHGIVEVPGGANDGMEISATTAVGFALGQNSFDNFASYSNFGSTVDLAGPGGDTQLAGTPAGDAVCTVGVIRSNCFVFDLVLAPGGIAANGSSLYFFAAGTSMATPHVAGTAALIVGQFGHIGPKAIRNILEHSSDRVLGGDRSLIGRGRVDAAAALGIQ
jgi:lantibiotic leader peptide-processing serine protease